MSAGVLAATAAVTAALAARSEPREPPGPTARTVPLAAAVGAATLLAAGAGGPLPRALGCAGGVVAAAALARSGSFLLFDGLVLLERAARVTVDGARPRVDRPGALSRALAAGGAGLLVAAARRRRRAEPARCARCGRRPGPSRSWPAWPGYAAVALSLPYPALKLAWELGSDLGMTDPELIHGAEGSWVPVVPALAGSALSLALVRPWGAALPRAAVLAPAWWGVAVLAAVAPGAVAAGVVYRRDPDADAGLAPWVPLTVYAAWLLWGAALAAAAAAYQQRTRPECAACGR